MAQVATLLRRYAVAALWHFGPKEVTIVCPFLGDDPTAPSVPMVVPVGIIAQATAA